MFKLKWYEWIGWLVNLLMVAVAVLFVVFTYLGDELRAALFAAAISLTLIGAWTWVLLYFERPRRSRQAEAPDGSEG